MRSHYGQTKWAEVVALSFEYVIPDLFYNNVPFDNTIPIYLINLLWKIVLGLGLD